MPAQQNHDAGASTGRPTAPALDVALQDFAYQLGAGLVLCLGDTVKGFPVRSLHAERQPYFVRNGARSSHESIITCLHNSRKLLKRSYITRYSYVVTKQPPRMLAHSQGQFSRHGPQRAQRTRRTQWHGEADAGTGCRNSCGTWDDTTRTRQQVRRVSVKNL